jgi:hypothetical protein
MKRLLILALTLMTGSLCFAQNRVPASWTSVETNGWESLAPTSLTVQSVFDWLDENWQPDLVTTSWLFLDPAEDTAQSTFDWLDAYVGTNGLMRGTNIFGFTFTNGVWTPPADLVGVENFAFVRDTNLTSTSAWGVELVADASWDTETESWLDDGAGTNTVAFISHPPFVTADGINFPSFVTKEEFYGILNSMGFANFDAYTYVADNALVYGGSDAPPDNAVIELDEDAFWVVPEGLVEGQVIGVHLWGGGGDGSLGGPGGYTYGELVVVTNAGNYTSAVPYHVTNGMRIAAHVGPDSGRAAVWRLDGSDFNSYTNELLVAGGGGRGASSSDTTYLGWGGFGGGATGGDGVAGAYKSSTYGDTVAAAGTGGSQSTNGVQTTGPRTYAGLPGHRVWGGVSTNRISGALYRGGDGLWGGATGAERDSASTSFNVTGGGGGGSGFVVAGWNGVTPGIGTATNALTAFTTNSAVGVLTPPGVGEVAYGLNAGYPGNPGRVAFEIRFDSWGE